MDEGIQKIEANSSNIDEMVREIVTDKLNELDNYLSTVRECFINADEMLDDSLDKIVLQLPVYMYNVIVFAQQLEMRKGVASETAKYAKNEALLEATGTVNEKTAKAENQTAKERLN